MKPAPPVTKYIKILYLILLINSSFATGEGFLFVKFLSDLQIPKGGDLAWVLNNPSNLPYLKGIKLKTSFLPIFEGINFYCGGFCLAAEKLKVLKIDKWKLTKDTNFLFFGGYLNANDFEKYLDKDNYQGKFSLNSYVYGISWAKGTDSHSLGITVKYAVEDLYKENRECFLIDLGLKRITRYKGKRLEFGLVLKNFTVHKTKEENEILLPSLKVDGEFYIFKDLNILASLELLKNFKIPLFLIQLERIFDLEKKVGMDIGLIVFYKTMPTQNKFFYKRYDINKMGLGISFKLKKILINFSYIAREYPFGVYYAGVEFEF